MRKRKEELLDKKMTILEFLPFVQGAMPYLEIVKNAKDLLEMSKEQIKTQIEDLMDVKKEFLEQASRERGHVGSTDKKKPRARKPSKK